MDAVFKGYGQNFDTVKWDTPDYDKLMHLERNVYQFSTAKNWQMMKDLTLATKDGNRIVPFREFRGKALNIVDEYEAKWLKTEYNAAIASSQMASKWVGYEQAAALRADNNLPEPQLQYRTQGDGRVREDHKVLDRITRPMSDNFWKTYYPPNGWNCRCTTIRLTTGTSSTDEVTNRAMADVAPQKGFNVNLAQEGFVFSPKSAYFVGVPDNIKQQVFSVLPYERRFETIYTSETKNKLGRPGTVLRHIDVDTVTKYNNPYNLHLKIAKELADRGDIVELIPETDKNDANRKLFPGIKGFKNPDLRVNKIFVEIKTPEVPFGENSIDNNIKKAGKQANVVLINLDSVPENTLSSYAEGRFRNSKSIEKIIFRLDGKYIEYQNKKRKL